MPWMMRRAATLPKTVAMRSKGILVVVYPRCNLCNAGFECNRVGADDEARCVEGSQVQQEASTSLIYTFQHSQDFPIDRQTPPRNSVVECFRIQGDERMHVNVDNKAL